MSKQTVIQALTALSQNFKVESAYPIEAHHKIREAMLEATHKFKNASAKWHRSVARLNESDEKKHNSEGNTSYAHTCNMMAAKHHDLADKITSGALKPHFKAS